MSTLVNDRARTGLLPVQSGGSDSRLIFGVPYENGGQTVIPVAELLDGAGPGDEPAGESGRGLIQERALGLIEIAGCTASYRPITRYRRSVIITVVALALVVIAALFRSRAKLRR